MFDSLGSRFSSAFGALRSRGKISAGDIDKTCIEIRQALLEADVSLEVVDDFVSTVSTKSLNTLSELQSGANQAQAVFDVVNAELIQILGGAERRIRFAKNPPTVIMLAGPVSYTHLTLPTSDLV